MIRMNQPSSNIAVTGVSASAIAMAMLTAPKSRALMPRALPEGTGGAAGSAELTLM